MDDNRLDSLLSRYQHLRKQGVAVTPEQLCADCPELLDPLKDRVQALDAMHAFLGRESLSEAQTQPPPTPAADPFGTLLAAFTNAPPASLPPGTDAASAVA